MKNDVYYAWLGANYKLDCSIKNFLLTLYGGAKEIYNAGYSDLKQSFDAYPKLRKFADLNGEKALLDKDLRAAESSLKSAEKFGAEAISIESPLYPESLKELPDAPVMLYAKGNSILLKEKGIAIVGTRRSSPYGRWAAEEIGKAVAAKGYTVVSGMAEGIDSCGHRGALMASGNTIAVFGCGIDICFPVSNRNLYEEISSKGLILSEYLMGETAHSYYFPMRNRIISGLSDKVIIVEGALKSGSMITAGLALEQGRDVYAVPGNINQPNSIGSNSLIADGATPILSLETLYDCLGISGNEKNRNIKSLSGAEKEIYECIASAGMIGLDGIASKINKNTAEILGIVSALELKRLIKRNGLLLSAT